MEYRPLEVTVISVDGHRKGILKESKYGVYAVATVSDSGHLNYPNNNNSQQPINKKYKTSTIIHNNKQLLDDIKTTWNFQPITFQIEEAAALRNRLKLVIKIKAVRSFLWDKTLCKVKVPIKDLLLLLNNNNIGSIVTTHNAVIKNASTNIGGSVIRFEYKFGEKYVKPVHKPSTIAWSAADTAMQAGLSGGGYDDGGCCGGGCGGGGCGA